MSRILHAALPADWSTSRAAGDYRVSSRGRTLADEGFLHASTAAQLVGVLSTYYADVPDVVLLVLDVEALTAAGSPVRWDDVPGAPAPFPHVYGPVPTTVVGQGNPVVATLDLSHRPDQPWVLPDLTPYDVATGPPPRD
jgi:uncharacterized protein (DUF952 family)